MEVMRRTSSARSNQEPVVAPTNQQTGEVAMSEDLDLRPGNLQCNAMVGSSKIAETQFVILLTVVTVLCLSLFTRSVHFF